MADVTEHTDDWYVRSFGELYPLIYRHRSDEQARGEAAAVAALLRAQPGERLLDIACGAGRHADAFTQLGLAAFGVDLSEPLLRRGRDRATLRGKLVRADVRALPFRGVFDAAVNLFTSFGYFVTDRENALALRQMVHTLRPGGTFLIDLVNRSQLERNFEPYDEQEFEGWRLRHTRQIHGDRVVKRTVAHDPGGQCHTLTESVRLYRPGELTAMCTAAGLAEVRLLGSFDGEPLANDSPRMIAVGRRA